jgi:hypothetical protein
MVMTTARALLARLREYVGDRRRSPRRGARFAARVPAAVTLLDTAVEYPPEASDAPSAAGETRDLGLSGLTLRVGRLSVGGQYLTDSDLHLGVRLELPAGEVSILAKVVRFEHTPEGGDDPGYLLGLRILKMRQDDSVLYTGFMRTLAPSDRRRRERGRKELLWVTAAGAEMGRHEDAFTSEDVALAFERFAGRGGPGGGA